MLVSENLGSIPRRLHQQSKSMGFHGEKNDWFKPHMKSWENTEGISGVKIFPRKP